MKGVKPRDTQMSLLPDVNEDGTLGEEKKIPTVYQPKEQHIAPRWMGTDAFKNDKHGTKQKVVDAPTMNDMHECVPDEDGHCKTCLRVMMI